MVGCSDMSGLWSAVHVTAGPDGVRRSGPYQEYALLCALIYSGSPDPRLDRSPSLPLHPRILTGPARLCRLCRGRGKKYDRVRAVAPVMMEIILDDTDVREPEPVGFLGERECISEMMRRRTFLATRHRGRTGRRTPTCTPDRRAVPAGVMRLADYRLGVLALGSAPRRKSQLPPLDIGP
jgi:hypothetical protein